MIGLISGVNKLADSVRLYGMSSSPKNKSLDKLLKKHQQLIHSEMLKVVSHVQRVEMSGCLIH